MDFNFLVMKNQCCRKTGHPVMCNSSNLINKHFHHFNLSSAQYNQFVLKVLFRPDQPYIRRAWWTNRQTHEQILHLIQQRCYWQIKFS